MSAIPSNLARVSTLLATRLTTQSLTRTTRDLLFLQEQLATGKALNRPSDDVVGTSAVSVLDDQIERRDQRLKNLSQGDAVLGSLDNALSDLGEVLQEAKAIGLSQIGVGSDAGTRANQAQVIDSLLNAAISIANREQQGIHYFGGSAHARLPIVPNNGGLRYAGSGEGMVTDVNLGDDARVTMSAEDAFGALSGRMRGFSDLDPTLTLTTRLSDLNGARNLGIAKGSIRVDVNGTISTVDLTDAETVNDVITRIQTAIQVTDPAATMQISATDAHKLSITPSAGFTVTITDPSIDAVAGDLGLIGTFPGGAATDGLDLNPRLTDLTPLSALPGLTLPLGTLRVRNANQTRDVDLSAAVTIQDVKLAFQQLQIGVRVEINADGDRLDARNELSGGVMSIEELAGGTTATQLGIRSFHTTTLLADFNDGKGVGNVTGQVDPITGLIDPTRNTDFRVTVKDGRTFDVDIDGAITVQDVINLTNTAAAAAGLTPVEFTAALAASGNGFEFTDTTVGVTTSVVDLNGSTAPADLGILTSSAGATLTGQDRATVAVNSVFSHLMALRDALLTNNGAGIEFATQRLDVDLSRAIEARADVGTRAQRIADATTREEDLQVLDKSLRSQVQDLDVTAAAVRFSSLQQSLQAGYQLAARLQNLSLLDFLR